MEREAGHAITAGCGPGWPVGRDSDYAILSLSKTMISPSPQPGSLPLSVLTLVRTAL